MVTVVQTSGQPAVIDPDASGGGPGYALVGFGSASGGTVNPDDTQTISDTITLTAVPDTFPILTIFISIPVQLTPTAPGDDLLFRIELQQDDAEPPDGPRIVRCNLENAPGELCQTMTAVFDIQLSSEAPTTFRLKGSCENGTTTCRFGNNALPFPSSSGLFRIYADPANVVAS
jgi:hypothetical protein